MNAAYARYSSHKQDDGTSIEVQLDACHRAAGDACVDYVDRACTGRSVSGRRQLLRLLDNAENGKVDRLFLYKYDRLGRNLAETSAIISRLEDCSVDIISVTEGEDTLARGMHLVIGEHYSRVLAERTRDGLIKRFQQGLWTGGTPPFGYKPVHNGKGRVLSIDEEEAPVVRIMFETYCGQTVGLKQLARQLERKGHTTRGGKPWAFTTIRSILNNPIYTGQMSYLRRRFKLNKTTGKRVPVRRDPSEHLTRQDESLRIITDEQFHLTRQNLAARSRGGRKPRAVRSIRPFTGHIHCEVCGSVCYCRQSKNRKGAYRYYSCGKRQRQGAETCTNSGAVREDILVRVITDTLAEMVQDTEAVIAAAVEEASKLARLNQDEAGRLARRLSRLEKRIGNLTDRLIDPDVSPAAKQALSRQLGEAEAQRNELHSALSGTAERSQTNAERLASAVTEALGEARESLLNVSTPAQLHELVGELVGPMLLRADGTVIQKKPAPEPSEAGVTSSIAGVGFEPTTSGL